MVNPPTWYIKIQLVLYIILIVSDIVTQHRFATTCLVIIGLSIILCVYLQYFEYSDFWWQNIMLFPVGCSVALLRDRIRQLFSWHTKKRRIGILVVSFIGFTVLSFLLVHNMMFVIRIIFRIVITMTAIIVFQCCNLYSKTFAFLGKHSLEIFLIHVGLCGQLFTENEVGEFDFAFYLMVVIIGMIIIRYLSNWILQKIRYLK